MEGSAAREIRSHSCVGRRQGKGKEGEGEVGTSHQSASSKNHSVMHLYIKGACSISLSTTTSTSEIVEHEIDLSRVDSRTRRREQTKHTHHLYKNKSISATNVLVPFTRKSKKWKAKVQTKHTTLTKKALLFSFLDHAFSFLLS